MNGFLILGGSIAGAQAAWDLAEAGLQVHVASETSWVLPPEGDLDARAWLLQVSRHPNIHFLPMSRVEALEKIDRGYHADIRVGSTFVDWERCTDCGECEKVCPVEVPGTSHRAIWRQPNGVPDVFAIEKLGQAPCSHACPGGIHVQGYVALIAQGRFGEALALIREAIPLPSVCGRVCHHPCEANCRRTDVDGAIPIRILKRFVADRELADGKQPSLLERKQKAENRGQGRKVAVIGSGPAGLTVAAELAIAGYGVTIFEALPVAGGMLAVGIPSYRLPKDILEMEIAAIESLGVEIRLNSPLCLSGENGPTIEFLLADGYEAVFLGVGAHKSMELRIPGEDLEGVVPGTHLLKAINLSHQVEDPRWQRYLEDALAGGRATRAAVIGGGNTAMDAARSLRRLGLEHVDVLYRRSREEMPAIPEEIEDAEKEGVRIHYLVSPVQIVGQAGRVSGVECVRNELAEPDDSGRRRPVPVPGSEFMVAADLVVPAIGQRPNLDFVSAGGGLEVTRRGTLRVDPVTRMTSMAGVFAAGDAIDQPASVIDAIGAAKRAAAAIDAYLRGISVEEAAGDKREAPVVERPLSEAERLPRPRRPVPTIDADKRQSSFDEVERSLDEDWAVEEASLCLACGPCSECMACVAVCEPQAIRHEWREDSLALDVASVLVAGEGFDPPASLASDVPRVSPDDRLGASAKAAQLMAQAAGWPRHLVESLQHYAVAETPRIGVWICACQGQISDRLSVEQILQYAGRLGDVVWAEAVDQACAPDARERLAQVMDAHQLNRVVVGACSCCSLDQVCHSCTTQRLRCKANLMSLNSVGAWIEFVNIREHSAWVYEDTAEATSVAESLVAAGVARARLYSAAPSVEYAAMPSALVVGEGPGAGEIAALLARIGLATSWASAAEDAERKDIPGVTRFAGLELASVEGALGNMRVTLRGGDGDRIATAGAVVLVTDGQERGDSTDVQVSGVYRVSADAPAAMREATAAKIGALLGRTILRTSDQAAAVDEAFCRACGTCEEVCPFEAITVRPIGDRRAAVVVAGRCVGCGLCVARCPSGALSLGAASDVALEATLEAACRGWK